MQKWIPSIVAALALGSSPAFAQYVICSFDSDASCYSGVNGALGAASFDGTVGKPAGSLYISNNWANATGWQETQYSFVMPGWPGLSMAPYINVEFDLKVDVAHSTLSDSGNYGDIQAVGQGWDGACGNTNLGWIKFGNFVIANTNGWQHYSMPVATFNGGCMNNFVLDMDMNTYGSGPVHAGPVSIWVDNIVFTTPPVPPTSFTTIGSQPMVGQLPCGGLVFDPIAGGQYERCMVYPGVPGAKMQWYNNTPATYSFKIAEFPTGSGFSGYQWNVFWVPTNAMMWGQADGSIDWNCTNDLILNYNNTGGAGGVGRVGLSAKTNLSGANPNVTIGGFDYAGSPVGTWSIKFTDNADLTVTAPDGTTHPFAIDPAVVEQISGNSLGNTDMQVYFGIFPGQNYNIGVPAVYNNITIATATTNITDSFCPINNSNAPSYLDPNTWAEIGSTAYVDCCPAHILPPLTPGHSKLTLSWLTGSYISPNALLASANPSGGWKSFIDPSNWINVATVPTAVKQAQFRPDDLDGLLQGAEATGGAYFRLAKRVASQLQVLLPGETNAPGTTTGKIGTPVPQSTGNAFDITVNACDSTWTICPSSDIVAITSSDTQAWLPPNTALVNGTVTIPGNFFFLQTGTWTVTATDTSNTNVTAGVSSPVQVPQ